MKPCLAGQEKFWRKICNSSFNGATPEEVAAKMKEAGLPDSVRLRCMTA